MNSVTDRVSRLESFLESGKIGCPAAKHFIKNGDSEYAVRAATGTREQVRSDINQALSDFWNNNNCSILAVVPEKEPENFAHSSDVFRSMYELLTVEQHRLFQEKFRERMSEGNESDARVLQFLHQIRFTIDQLEFLWEHHGDKVWKYASAMRPLAGDLNCPYPRFDHPIGRDDMITFVVSPQYPPYPTHRRRSEVSALIVTKDSDIAKLQDEPHVNQQNVAWSSASKERYTVGVHTPYPTLEHSKAQQLEDEYFDLREKLAESGDVRPLYLSTEETFIRLCRECGIQREMQIALLHEYSITIVIAGIRYCIDNNEDDLYAVLDALKEQAGN